jgi:hypothetical protein
LDALTRLVTNYRDPSLFIFSLRRSTLPTPSPLIALNWRSRKMMIPASYSFEAALRPLGASFRRLVRRLVGVVVWLLAIQPFHPIHQFDPNLSTSSNSSSSFCSSHPPNHPSISSRLLPGSHRAGSAVQQPPDSPDAPDSLHLPQSWHVLSLRHPLSDSLIVHST